MMHVLLALLLVAGACAHIDPDQKRTGPELITSKGYPFEDHYVTTDDGYILRTFRIKHGLHSKTVGKPLLLMHGFFDSADTWLVNSATESLAYIAADAGFDVWLGNSRGNKYATNHTTLNPKKKEFWQFSWDEMASSDLPAVIDYVLKENGAPKLAYAGHSQGTTQMWANLANQDTSVKDKLAVFLALAPVAYVYNTKSPLLKGASDLDLDKLVALVDDKSILPSTALLRTLLPDVCRLDPSICNDMVAALAGWSNKTNLNQTRWGVYTSHFPSGTSVKNLEKWAQGVRTDNFQMYNYDRANNEKHYHQSTPPPYYLPFIKAPPIALFWGGHDDLGDTKDVEHLVELVPNATIVEDNYFPDWGHMDFVWGLDAPVSLYPKVIAAAKKYLGM